MTLGTAIAIAAIVIISALILAGLLILSIHLMVNSYSIIGEIIGWVIAILLFLGLFAVIVTGIYHDGNQTTTSQEATK